MHHLPRIFSLKKQHKNMDESKSSKPKSKSMDLSQSPRKLLRRNAAKNFNFTPSDSSTTSPSTSESSAPRTRSLDSPHALGMTSFRIDGKYGEVDSILQSLGLSGPEDLEIPKADYELLKNKNRSSPGIMQRPKKGHFDHNVPKVPKEEAKNSSKFVEHVPHRFGNSVRTNVPVDPDSGVRDWKQHRTSPLHISSPVTDGTGVGIRGDRPPFLTAPPPMALPTSDDHNCSTWDLLERLAPDSDTSPSQCHAHASDAETDGENAIREVDNGVRLGETVIMSGSCSFTTSNDDDTSSTTTSIISPNGGGKINITQWERGKLLGQGSFGTVYEGISSEGFFFAMKEVSLLEQGSQAKQSIYQLEQEIELLSQFEHENIVRYLGTEQADSKLYIFLELVTQGSLASLYQKYHLRDSHVSAYTRQILMGLKYLHDRNVVHRDIKCANILVASNGMVKLADFGLAKATRLNDLKSCKGTAFWMAPEVIYHESNGYGLAADIWSLGCTVLEMLTRHIPYYPLELPQAFYRIGKGKLPPIPDYLSTDARDFIQQCLRVNANDRPTAAELLDHQFVQRPLYIPFGSESPMMPDRLI